jgi:hypothetical protein
MNRHCWTRLCSVFFVKSLLPRIVAGAHTLHAAPLTNREQKNLLQRKKMHRTPIKSSFAGVLMMMSRANLRSHVPVIPKV